jgi:ABC-type antimicrobial peptide transport system permease subunit
MPFDPRAGAVVAQGHHGHGVRPFDPLTLAASVAILAGCATAALLVPVLRATRVDPAIALREQ